MPTTTMTQLVMNLRYTFTPAIVRDLMEIEAAGRPCYRLSAEYRRFIGAITAEE